MYDMKALYEAESVENAVALRLEHPEAQIIAGGSDVLVQMREGKLAGCELVSIYGLDELRGVRLEEDGTIRIGSLTSFSHITRDPVIQRHIRVLGEAVDMVGGPQIRNIGTIGGNTCNGVTSCRFRRFTCAPGWSISGRANCRRPSSSAAHPTRAIRAITSNTPCATPWTSPPPGVP